MKLWEKWNGHESSFKLFRSRSILKCFDWVIIILETTLDVATCKPLYIRNNVVTYNCRWQKRLWKVIEMTCPSITTNFSIPNIKDDCNSVLTFTRKRNFLFNRSLLIIKDNDDVSKSEKNFLKRTFLGESKTSSETNRKFVSAGISSAFHHKHPKHSDVWVYWTSDTDLTCWAEFNASLLSLHLSATTNGVRRVNERNEENFSIEGKIFYWVLMMKYDKDKKWNRESKENF